LVSYLESDFRAAETIPISKKVFGECAKLQKFNPFAEK